MLLSIILPVYKVEKYLDDCVKSVISQSFDNYEIILVDDGSPDKCGTMCDFWSNANSK
ncbi:MAG: glycosyltransferase, partial [Oscillospiraceae bacterium]